MLSFDILCKDNFANTLNKLTKALGEGEILEDILASFLDISEEGAEVGVGASSGMLLVRIFDEGRYSFVYPIEVGDGYDVDAALLALSEYSVRELIPFYLTDTPREELDRLGRLFSHVDARAYDDDVDSFVALIYSECDMLDGVPSIAGEGVYLDEITEVDIPRYAALCRSDDVNKYWGYDYAADAADATDEYFLRVAEGELARGVALSLAVREKKGGSLVGEAVIFDFDYRGGAKVAVRLLPEVQGRGLGTRAFGTLIELARQIGVKRVRTEVMKENLPSIKMTGRLMPSVGEKDGKLLFALEL